MNKQTIKFGKGRLKRFYASVAYTYTSDPMENRRSVKRAGVVSVTSTRGR